MKQVTQKRDTSRRRARLIGASLFATPAAGLLVRAVKVSKEGDSWPQKFADVGDTLKSGESRYANLFKSLGRRSPKALFAMGLGGVGLAALTGAVLGRGVQHSYRRSQLRYPLSSRARGVGAGITKGLFAAPLIAVRDVRRRLFGKQYGLGGV